jgi:tRNA G46 methylase TrmB
MQKKTSANSACVPKRMSDPWMALSKDYNSTAQVYTDELATDAALQLLELGFGKAKN